MAEHLPLLEAHKREHTYCTYCPKLCRFSCPVSTAQGSETTTPWAKMTSLHHAAEGRLTASESVASAWYACSGCMRCKSHCDHDNEVADALGAGRAEAVRLGTAPKAATDVIEQFDTRQERAAAAGRAIFGDAEGQMASTVFAPGCTACVLRPDDAKSGFEITQALSSSTCATQSGLCCGLPLLEAGDPDGFVEKATRYIAAFETADEVIVQDPGCLHAIVARAPRFDIDIPDKFVHISQFVDTHRNKLETIEVDGPLRYHDPCKLGRGLGVYEEPRRVLEKILGRPADEFFHKKDDAECSGAGGQLPRTDPDTATIIADARIEEHTLLGGGIIVTACPESANRFEKNKAGEVLDFTQLVRRALPKKKSQP